MTKFIHVGINATHNEHELLMKDLAWHRRQTGNEKLTLTELLRARLDFDQLRKKYGKEKQ